MAKLLNDGMSSQVHISNANRHVRLCKQTKGTEVLVDAMTPKISTLKEKYAATLGQKENRDAAYDSLVFNDAVLDDRIRSTSDISKQYDRDNPGRPVHKLLFPDGGYTSVLRSSYAKKANTAEEIIERIKSLGEEHQLAGQIIRLTESIAKVRSSITALQQANTNVRTAIANEEVAQANLRQQYEFNYLDAIKLFGKSFANRLFPQTVSKKKIEEDVTIIDA